MTHGECRPVTNPASTVLLLLAAVTLLALASRKFLIPYPTLMVLAGATLGWIPGLPHLEFDSETVLLVFLPPLLYAAAWQMSWRDFRSSLRPISLLAVGLVLATTVVVAVLAHECIDGMSWPLAFALGALVAPPDAVAAAAVTQRLPLPPRLVTIIEGESLVNDATGLVLYRSALAAAVTGVFSPSEAAMHFLLAPVGGVAVGIAIGWLAVWTHRQIKDATIESVFTLLTPFAAYIPAELMDVSGVLATVAAGMYVSKHASTIFAPSTRLHATATWDVLVFVLNGLAFTLIGLQIPLAFDAVSQRPLAELLLLTGLVCVTVIAVRMLWVFPAAYIPRLLFRSVRDSEPRPRARDLVVLGWAGMRGVVTIAAALALPRLTADGSPLPNRNIVVLVAFAVVLCTLILQGQTLAALIRWLNVAPEAQEHSNAAAEARREILYAALHHLDLEAIRAENSKDHEMKGAVGHLRERYWRLLAAELAPEITGNLTPPVDSLCHLTLDVLTVQRRKLSHLARHGLVPQEICRQIERMLDLEEARVQEALENYSE